MVQFKLKFIYSYKIGSKIQFKFIAEAKIQPWSQIQTYDYIMYKQSSS